MASYHHPLEAIIVRGTTNFSYDDTETALESTSLRASDPKAGSMSSRVIQSLRRRAFFTSPFVSFSGVLESWKWEICTWGFATSIICAILVLFGVYHSQPQSTFHSRIQITTIVALAGTGAQSALLSPITSCLNQLKWIHFQRPRPLFDLQKFDDASRGPWGSVLMLFGGRSSTLVRTAAFATLTMLSYAAFAQQSIGIANQWTYAEGGTMSRVLTYGEENFDDSSGTTVFPFAKSNDGYLTFKTFSSVPGPLIAAVSSGLLVDNITPSAVMGFCPTSNCTWPSYSSLAVCSSVQDVTSKINGSQLLNEPQKNYTYSVTPSFIFNPFAGTNLITGKFLLVSLSATEYPDKSDPTNLARFNVIFFRDLTKARFNSTVINNKTDLVAFEGRLDLCVQKFRSVMINGTTTTSLLETYRGKNLTTQLNGTYANATSKGPLSGLFMQVPGEPLEYNMSYRPMAWISSYLGFMTFWGTAESRPQWTQTRGYSTDAARGFAKDIYENRTTIIDNGQAAVEARLQNLATSLTNALRTSAVSRKYATGIASTLEPYIVVDFRWMIVPVLLDIGVFVLLMCTIVLTTKRKIPAWKSSQLAVLYAADSWSRGQLTENVTTLENDAKVQNVYLKNFTIPEKTSRAEHWYLDCD